LSELIIIVLSYMEIKENWIVQ